MSESFNESLDEIRELNRALGRLDEQERIIKLLENHEHIWRERVAYEALIALIKGEQK